MGEYEWAAYAIASTSLYSTGHWIGGTVLLLPIVIDWILYLREGD